MSGKVSTLFSGCIISNQIHQFQHNLTTRLDNGKHDTAHQFLQPYYSLFCYLVEKIKLQSSIYNQQSHNGATYFLKYVTFQTSTFQKSKDNFLHMFQILLSFLRFAILTYIHKFGLPVFLSPNIKLTEYKPSKNPQKCFDPIVQIFL